MSDSGFLLLFDLSGYTGFITRADLSQAGGILQSLFGTLVQQIRPPLTIAELEGDAIFAHAPSDAFRGSELRDTMQAVYCTFAAAREQMERTLACSCAGCAEVPNLDLKIVAHHGAFTLRAILPGQPAKPVGADVVAAHRLLKNHIAEVTGIRAWAFFTDSCITALGAGAVSDDAVAHDEEYDHIGRISGRVVDLEPGWRRERRRRLLAVDSEHAWLTVTCTVPADTATVWEGIRSHEFRSAWTDGRFVLGNALALHPAHAERCFQGELVDVERVLDWEPQRRLTLECAWPLASTVYVTFDLEPADTATTITARLSRPAPAASDQEPALRAWYRTRERRIAEGARATLERLHAARNPTPAP